MATHTHICTVCGKEYACPLARCHAPHTAGECPTCMEEFDDDDDKEEEET